MKKRRQKKESNFMEKEKAAQNDYVTASDIEQGVNEDGGVGVGRG